MVYAVCLCVCVCLRALLCSLFLKSEVHIQTRAIMKLEENHQHKSHCKRQRKQNLHDECIRWDIRFDGINALLLLYWALRCVRLFRPIDRCSHITCCFVTEKCKKSFTRFRHNGVRLTATERPPNKHDADYDGKQTNRL